MANLFEESQNKKDEINLKLRSKILEYSLNLEELVNLLLAAYLGITDKSTTRLFGNKAGISFKNKIDLLFDINVLSKEENGTLELLMVIRNKFIHDISCNSFIALFNQLDNGIKNKFKKYLNTNDQIDNEESCYLAFINLHGVALKIFKEKIQKKQNDIRAKGRFLGLIIEQNKRLTELLFDFPADLLGEMELANLEDPKIAALIDVLSQKCTNHVSNIVNDKKTLRLKKRFEELSTEKMISSIMGVGLFDE